MDCRFDLSASGDTVVIVIQVHNRANYLRHLLASLRKSRHIEQTLIIFSHDFYDPEIMDVVKTVDFCPVREDIRPFLSPFPSFLSFIHSFIHSLLSDSLRCRQETLGLFSGVFTLFLLQCQKNEVWRFIKFLALFHVLCSLSGARMCLCVFVRVCPSVCLSKPLCLSCFLSSSLWSHFLSIKLQYFAVSCCSLRRTKHGVCPKSAQKFPWDSNPAHVCAGYKTQ